MSLHDFPMDDVVDRSQAGTPPITIVSPQAPRMLRTPSAQRNELAPGKINIEEVVRNAAKQKKKKKKNMKPGAPATTIARGFHTPGASGEEESDISAMSTPRIGPSTAHSSITSSPALRPQANPGGISALKQQLENLSIGQSLNTSDTSAQRLQRCESNTTVSTESYVSNGSDSDRTETETYEISLENDFMSPEATEPPSTVLTADLAASRRPTMARKMTAADFEPLNCLGKGTYGTVLLVRQRGTGRLYAQKQFRKASLTVHKRLIEHTKSERAILESVNRHPFIVKLYYAFQDQEKLYLILEYAQGGELFHHLSAETMFDETKSAFYMAEMVLALEHLHVHMGVVYRDLKPENILLDADGHLLLTDFGLSKVAVDGVECKSMLGTIEYMAPEVIEEKPYGMAVDWWSLGALGFDLLTGSPPFQANNYTKIQEKILKAKPTFPFYLSADAKDLLTRLLRKNPRKRLGANMPKDLDAIKKHRFFRKIDWAKLERKDAEPPICPVITDPALAENFDPEFVKMNLAPLVEAMDMGEGGDVKMAESNPFGGFSYVASESLLESGFLPVY